MERAKVKKFCCSLPAYQYGSIKYIAEKLGSDVSSILDSCISFTLAMEPKFKKLSEEYDKIQDEKNWKKEYLKLQKEKENDG